LLKKLKTARIFLAVLKNADKSQTVGLFICILILLIGVVRVGLAAGQLLVDLIDAGCGLLP